MRISDELMWRYYELLTDVSVAEIEKMKEGAHPMQAKKDLALRIVADFHSREGAAKAGEDWENRDEAPDEIGPHDVSLEMTPDGRARLDKLVWREGFADSVADAARKIKQGAVRVNGEVKTDPVTRVNPDELIILQVGKQRPTRLRVRLVRGTRPTN
jgi:tyrosyl-tRNA synthetase